MSKNFNQPAQTLPIGSDDLSPRGDVIQASNTGRNRRRSARRLVGIVVGSLSAVVGIAGPAHAATYRIGATQYDSKCGSTTSMVSNFVANAYSDSSAKVDFLDLKQSGRINLPSSCPAATQLCLSGRITANSTRGFVSDAPFGAWQVAGLWDNSQVIKSATTAAAFGSKCKSINARRETITAYPADNNAENLVFLTTGGYSKLTSYTFEVRVRWLANGTWHYGGWASYSKKL